MAPFPDPHQVSTALSRTWDVLNLSADSPLSTNEASVFLKYLLLSGLNNNDIQNLRAQRQSADIIPRLNATVNELMASMMSNPELEVTPSIDWEFLSHALKSSLYFQHRLIDLVLEALLSEPLAPELILRMSTCFPEEFSAVLPGKCNHAVIFSSPICLTHELYPLIVDAYVHDAEQFGFPQINILGVHMDWLTLDGKLNRIIYLDVATGRFIETDLKIPVIPDSVQFLCLGSQEQEIHRVMSNQFNCVQVNPAKISRLADDKAGTLFGWSSLGLEVPAYQAIAPGDFAAAYRFFDSYTDIVIKPNQASEGEQVAFFQHSQPESRAAFALHLEHCWEQGTAIIQQRRDSVCFRDQVSGNNRSLVLRLNIIFDGKKYCLESGYAVLGQDTMHPATCGCGGRIIPIYEALSGLYHDNDLIRLGLRDWYDIRLKTEHAASLFDGLMLVGLDVLLDFDRNGNVIPVFLEANPRPAGLSHSRQLSDDPLASMPIGVSLKLWSGINQLQTKELSKCLS